MLRRVNPFWRTHPPTLRIPYLVAIGTMAGVLAGLAVPGIGWWPMAWLMPALLIGLYAYRVRISQSRLPAWQLGLATAAYGAGWGAMALGWLWGLHPLTWLGIPGWASLLITCGVWLLGVGWLALFYGVAGLCLSAFPLALWPLAMGGVILVLSWVYLWSPFGLPWGLTVYTQLDNPVFGWLAQQAWRPPTLAFEWLLFGGASAAGLLVAGWQPTSHWLQHHGRRLLPGARLGLIATVVLYSHLQAGGALQGQPSHPVVLLQGNLSIATVKQFEERQGLKGGVHPVYAEMLRQLKAPAGTLVVLPEEGVIPGWVLPKTPTALAPMQAIASQRGWWLVVGVALWEQNHAYNAMALIRPDSRPVYYRKQQLVPFGETVPIIGNANASALLKAVGIDYQFAFEAGPQQTTWLPASPGLALEPFICYELAFAPYRQTPAGEHGLVINAANLAWFHHHPWLAKSMGAFARMTALSRGKPVVSVSGTGPSLMVAANGQLRGQLPTNRMGGLRITHEDVSPLHFMSADDAARP